MSADSRRLSILTARELDDLYGLPHFTEDDRLLYFDLSPAEREAMDSVHTTALAERYNDPDFWSRALREEGLDGQVH